MMYAPHILYKKTEVVKMDELGKPLPYEVEWAKVGVCRCDDDSTQELTSENGQVYKSRYHVVYDRSQLVKEGDEVKCLNPDGSLRGHGVVGMVKSTNYLSYSELWT